MVNIANPLIDAEMDDETRRYVGVLERQVVGLTITTSKQKAVIEYLTGIPHEDLLKDMEKKEVLDIVTQVVQAKNPDLSRTEAKKIAFESLEGTDPSSPSDQAG